MDFVDKIRKDIRAERDRATQDLYLNLGLEEDSPPDGVGFGIVSRPGALHELHGYVRTLNELAGKTDKEYAEWEQMGGSRSFKSHLLLFAQEKLRVFMENLAFAPWTTRKDYLFFFLVDSIGTGKAYKKFLNMVKDA